MRNVSGLLLTHKRPRCALERKLLGVDVPNRNAVCSHWRKNATALIVNTTEPLKLHPTKDSQSTTSVLVHL